MTSRDWWRAGVRAPERLAALQRSGLFETGPEDAFDRLTELAAAVTGATKACITLVDSTQYVYKSAVGVADDAPNAGPVEASFCRYVVGSSKPLIVDDSRNDPRTFDNPAIEEGVAAWAGYPIEDADGWVLGTFCLVAIEPYAWTDTDLHVLATLARAASSEIALRHAQAVIASATSTAGQLEKAAEGDLDAITAQPTSQPRREILQRVLDLVTELSDVLRPGDWPPRER